jgi:hypothetical protein
MLISCPDFGHEKGIICYIVRLMILNLVESSLMGKIQVQSVSTYVLNSLSVLTLF